MILVKTNSLFVFLTERVLYLMLRLTTSFDIWILDPSSPFFRDGGDTCLIHPPSPVLRTSLTHCAYNHLERPLLYTTLISLKTLSKIKSWFKQSWKSLGHYPICFRWAQNYTLRFTGTFRKSSGINNNPINFNFQTTVLVKFIYVHLRCLSNREYKYCFKRNVNVFLKVTENIVISI